MAAEYMHREILICMLACACVAVLRKESVVTFSLLGSYGRLGNQLFQIAAVEYYAEALGVRAVLPETVRGLPVAKVVRIGCAIETRTHTRILSEVSASAPPVREMPSAMPSETLDLRGYFQNRAFVRRVPSLLPRASKIAEKYAGYVGIHVRRGDYLALPGVFQPLGADYYSRALKVLGLSGTGSRKIIVCSDDIPWCKANLDLPASTEFSEYREDIDDFAVLAGCSALVMSNSSFSWWAAQYNKGVPGRVAMPTPWFTGSDDVSAYLCPGWLVVPALA